MNDRRARGAGSAGAGPAAVRSGVGTPGGLAAGPLGRPRLHLRQVDSTNLRARELAIAGAPHGTLVTAAEQAAGRGRQGRQWASPPGTSLLMSLILREPPRLLSLAAGVAVAETVEILLRRAVAARAEIKWPNDVLLDGRKVAGILVEGRPLERWAVLGIGVNVAIPRESFAPELRDRAGTLGLDVAAIEPTLVELLRTLERWTAASEPEVLSAVRERDALIGRPVAWGERNGTAAGIDGSGRLLVELDDEDGGTVALDAGEVHLTRSS